MPCEMSGGMSYLIAYSQLALASLMPVTYIGCIRQRHNCTAFSPFVYSWIWWSTQVWLTVLTDIVNVCVVYANWYMTDRLYSIKKIQVGGRKWAVHISFFFYWTPNVRVIETGIASKQCIVFTLSLQWSVLTFYVWNNNASPPVRKCLQSDCQCASTSEDKNVHNIKRNCSRVSGRYWSSLRRIADYV